MRAVSVVLSVCLALAACGGGGDDDAGTTTTASTTTTEVPGGTDRPEGDWVMVSWEATRNGEPQSHSLTAVRARAWTLSPTCPSGPCDIEVTPTDDGLPPGNDGFEGYEAGEAFTLTWDADEQRYTTVTEVASESCKTVDADGAPVTYPATYSTRLVDSYEFVAGSPGTPAQLVGSREGTYTNIDSANAQPCPTFTFTSTRFASPSIDEDATAEDLLGEFHVTEQVYETDPPNRAPGFEGTLIENATIEGDPPTLSGVRGPIELTEGDSGWGGTTTVTGGSCTGGTDDGHFEYEETWSDLQPIARTPDGELVWGGNVELAENPTPAGVTAGCVFGLNTGYVTLLPASALD